jgi:hypothetical protein
VAKLPTDVRNKMGFKKVKDAPLLERMKFIHGENKELDKKQPKQPVRPVLKNVVRLAA